MKNFNEIYQKIYQDNHEELEKLRKSSNKRKYIIFAISIVMVIFIIINAIHLENLGDYIEPLVVLIIFLTGLPLLLPVSKKYKHVFKSKVMTELVKYYDPNLTFNEIGLIPQSLYKEAEFERYDIYTANDLISGKIDNTIEVKLGDVHTSDQSSDSNGATTTTTVFQGLFSAALLNKDLNSTIKIRSDKGFLGKLLPNKKLLQMDSQEFEKNFDIYADDKILAMRLLTSDILDYMLTFKKENKIKFEMTLKKEKLFIRIHCSDMFEATTTKDSLDYDTLYKYYKFLHFICELNRKIYHTLNEKDL